MQLGVVKTEIIEKNLINLFKSIPIKYQQELIDFIKQKKFGIFSFIIQEGKIVGCDITSKDRLPTDKRR